MYSTSITRFQSGISNRIQYILIEQSMQKIYGEDTMNASMLKDFYSTYTVLKLFQGNIFSAVLNDEHTVAGPCKPSYATACTARVVS